MKEVAVYEAETRLSELPAEILALSLRFSLTAYDASRLALALRLQVPVAMVAEALRTAARAVGVGVVP